MSKDTRYIGLDAHTATIAVTIAEGRSQVRSLGEIPSPPRPFRRVSETSPLSPVQRGVPGHPASGCGGFDEQGSCQLRAGARMSWAQCRSPGRSLQAWLP